MENKKYQITIARSGQMGFSATFMTILDLESWFANRHCDKTNTIAFYSESGDYIFTDLSNCSFRIQEIKQ